MDDIELVEVLVVVANFTEPIFHFLHRAGRLFDTSLFQSLDIGEIRLEGVQCIDSFLIREKDRKRQKKRRKVRKKPENSDKIIKTHHLLTL